MALVAAACAASLASSAPAPVTPPGAPPSSAANAPTRASHMIAIAEDARRADGTLQRFLRDPDPKLRQRAVLALGRLQDSTTVDALVPLLTDPEFDVRREAVFALGQIGHRSARAPLEKLLVSGEVRIEDLAIEALGKIGDKASTPHLTVFLGDDSALLRGEAAVALWRLADSTAVDALLRHHDDVDPEVRWRVLYALEKIVQPARVVLHAALHVDDPEWIVRAQAVRTLGRQKSSRGTAYVVQKLDDPEVPVVVNAIRALQLIADSTSSACARGLIRALGHPHPYVRVTAAGALADRFTWAQVDSMTRRTARDSLTAHLADPDAATRGAAARALLARDSDAAFARVAPLLDDPSIYTRVAVLNGLRSLHRGSAHAEELRRRLSHDQPLFVRMTAAEVLGSRNEPGTRALLRAGLADSTLLYVAACAAALAESRDSASVPALARAYAARAGDADPDARISIRDALRDLAGRAYADSVERAHPPRNTAPPPEVNDIETPSSVRGVVLHTTAGDIEWEFFGSEAPLTVKNFVRLASERYFDGLAIHRVVPNFVIQDGDPTGTGSGGPGYTIRCEYNRLRYDTGMVGMALSGKDTGGSQWFITHAPQPHLNGRYTIFARVIRGMDVVGRIVQGDRVNQVELVR